MAYAGVRLALTLFLAGSLQAALAATTVGVLERLSPGQASTLHADLNQDGCEDLVLTQGNGNFAVEFSHCDGTYGAPVSYAIPGGADAGPIAIADFNNDSTADLAVFGTDNAVHVFLNDGHGDLHQGAVFSQSGLGDAYTAVAGDFNHDGHMDIAFQGGLYVKVLFGTGSGSFVAGPSRGTSVGGYLLLGDFDGDGRADVAVGDLSNYNAVQVLYGDGTGHFPTSRLLQTTGGHSLFYAVDVNNDAKMDIVGSQYYPSAKALRVFYGDSDRSFGSRTIIPLAHCNGFGVVAADMNGDRLNDLVVGEADCNNNSQTGSAYIGVLTRNRDSSYNPQQTVATAPSYIDDVSAIRANPDSRADISFLSCIKAPCSALEDQQIGTLLNTTASSSPSCAPPDAFVGIRVCSPPSSTGSPAQFTIGAAGQTEMRKVEVWVDGTKRSEQWDSFSKYAFMNRSLSLSTGTHRMDVYAAGWDNSLVRRSFTVRVP